MARDDDRKRDLIIIEDAVSNKTIQSHPLNKRPKVESLTKVFKNLFTK